MVSKIHLSTLILTYLWTSKRVLTKALVKLKWGAQILLQKTGFPAGCMCLKFRKNILTGHESSILCSLLKSTNIIITEKISGIINVYVLFFKYSLIKYRSCTAEICNDLLFHSTWSMLGNTFLKNDCRGRNVRN